MQKKFKNVSITKYNPKWNYAITRIDPIYQKTNDIRTDFERDHTRILYSNAYRRLKHKTQVFYIPNNDHVCTRLEHVNCVASISCNIAKHLGLNEELTRAIAIAHDLGHPPFGHQGEEILKNITKQELNHTFWHEKNSLRFLDNIETLVSSEGFHENLNLTYAVRDGVVLHCGETDDVIFSPREQCIDLNDITNKEEFMPYTWEACIVKFSDVIAYLGRDIEDAFRLGILNEKANKMLNILKKEVLGDNYTNDINSSSLIHIFVTDLCKTSTPETGICLSKTYAKLMDKVKDFNKEYIYFSKELLEHNKYTKEIIFSIFDRLKDFNKSDYSKFILYQEFYDWMVKYSNLDIELRQKKKYNNKIIYDKNKHNDCVQAIVDFISGMTDNFALRATEIIMRGKAC